MVKRVRFYCPIGNCQESYSRKQRLRIHIYTDHKRATQTESACTLITSKNLGHKQNAPGHFHSQKGVFAVDPSGQSLDIEGGALQQIDSHDANSVKQN